MSVDESVDQIQHWLAGKAPRLLAKVNPSVSDAEFDAVVREVKAPPSQDLAAWWRRMNGVSTDVMGGLIPPGYSPVSATAALDVWRMHRSVQYDYHPEHQHSQLDEFLGRLMDEPAGTSCGQPVWIAAWLPFATNISGGLLVVDLRQGSAHGCVMRYDVHDGCQRTGWSGVAEMLQDVATALQKGFWAAGESYPYVDEYGRLVWLPEPPGDDVYTRWACRLP